jgi:hypothetical protein
MPDIGEKDRAWRRKGSRLSKKAKESQEHFDMQRQKMERLHTQRVKIVCHKTLLLPPGLHKSFTVRLNIPLRKKDIDKRMAAAFPECEWGES